MCGEERERERGGGEGKMKEEGWNRHQREGWLAYICGERAQGGNKN